MFHESGNTVAKESFGLKQQYLMTKERLLIKICQAFPESRLRAWDREWTTRTQFIIVRHGHSTGRDLISNCNSFRYEQSENTQPMKR